MKELIQISLTEKEAHYLMGFYLIGMGQATTHLKLGDGTMTAQVLKDVGILVNHGLDHLKYAASQIDFDSLDEKMDNLHKVLGHKTSNPLKGI